MNKEELLAEAKRRYHVGTKFIPAHSDYMGYKCIVTNNNFEFTNRQGCEVGIVVLTDEGRYYTSSSEKYGNTCFDRIVYKDEKWATIISTPEFVLSERWCVKNCKEVGELYDKNYGHACYANRYMNKYLSSHNMVMEGVF